MRRDNIRKKPKNDNTMLYVTGTILVSLIAAFVVILAVYNFKVKSNNDSSFDSSDLASVMQNTTSASKEIGKGVNEIKENNTTTEKIAINTSNLQKNNTVTTKNTTQKVKKETKKEEKQEVKKEETQVKEERKLEFARPIEGDILREYAKDNLVYSNTLEEWIVHNGIDIKAEQGTTVKAAEEGTVKSIKNDPRYGLTIQVEHINGYITVYSNLQTSEFVVEGEKVTKGQTIGTVGNTSSFEILDESHLHFEILKDNIAINPLELL